MKILFKKLKKDAHIPAFGGDDPSNAGLDLCACIPTPVIIQPRQSVVIPIGIAWEPQSDQKCVMIVKSRSGMAFNQGIEVTNAGVIDQGYRGEFKVLLYNYGATAFTVYHGQKIAQGIIQILPDIEVGEVEELSASLRGEQGFGSTGK